MKLYADENAKLNARQKMQDQAKGAAAPLVKAKPGVSFASRVQKADKHIQAVASCWDALAVQVGSMMLCQKGSTTRLLP